MGEPSPDAAAGLSLDRLATIVGHADPAASLHAPSGTDPAATLVTGATLDSRAVRPGDLYAALPGANTHGARFAGAAATSGAVAALTDPAGAGVLADQPDAAHLPVLVCADPRAVLGHVAAAIHGEPAAALRTVGVTGTNGKTTTAYLVESALRAAGMRTGLIGTVETRIGDERVESVRTTPESPDVHALFGRMRAAGIDACVMEVSSHALSLHRVDGVLYDVALFTNLSQDHLDFHADMQEYFRAKASLFTPERARRGVVCVDDEWGTRLATTATVPVVTLASRGRDADWSVGSVGPDGEFTLAGTAADGTEVTMRLVSHLPGHFNVANTAMAALALLQLGLTPAQAESACRAKPVVPGRMEVVSTGRPGEPRCVVDYAHTPDAVESALAALRPTTRGRLVAVLGAGGDRDRGKRAAMGAAAARHADIVIVTDDNPRGEDPASIREAVLAGASAEQGGRAELVDIGSRAEAIAHAVGLAGRTGTVAVLGKGHEKGQETAGVKHHFDDREQVLAALEALPVTSPTSTGGADA